MVNCPCGEKYFWLTLLTSWGSHMESVIVYGSHLLLCSIHLVTLKVTDFYLLREQVMSYMTLFTVELAMIMDRLYGGVCYAGIDTDPELKYPKGAGRVAFSNQQSYIAAISARFVQLQHGDIDKRVSLLLHF